MLLVLTGDIQTGKTTWLLGAVNRLEAAGVAVEGVVAPGAWRPVDAGDLGYDGANAPLAAGPGAAGEWAQAGVGRRYDKLGIDNVLLPEHETMPFARREDLARAEGRFDVQSQAARAGLVWHIDDRAIGRVNAHFDALATHIAERTAAGGAAEGDGSGKPRHRVLVVDELGRLELMCGEGLTSAMALLARGPQGYYDHAVVVARDMLGLNDRVEELFADVWCGSARITPGDGAWDTWFTPLAG